MLQHGAKVKMPNGTVARVIRQTGERVQVQYAGPGGVAQSAIVLEHGLEVLDASADPTFLKHGPGSKPEEDRQVVDGETSPADASSHVLTELELATSGRIPIDDRDPRDLTGETEPASCVDTEAVIAAPVDPAPTEPVAPEPVAPEPVAPEPVAPDADAPAPEGSAS